MPANFMFPFINFVIVYFAILWIGGMSGYSSERVGIVNLAIDGYMIITAMFYAILSKYMGEVMGDAGFFLASLITGVFGMMVASLHGFATITLKVNHIISGIAINLLAAGIAIFINVTLGQSLYDSNSLKSGFDEFSPVAIGFYISSILIILFTAAIIFIYFIAIKYTKFGIRMIAVGENPNSVDSQGINVTKYQWIGVLLSGFFAGIAGSIFMFYNTSFTGSVDGMGFLCVAITIAGGWKIPNMTFFAFLFALLTGMARRNIFPMMFGGQIDPWIWESIPYIITVVSLVFFSKRNRVPKNSGMHFNKGRR